MVILINQTTTKGIIISNLTNILNNFDNESINVKDLIQEVRNYENGHFGLNFSLNDLVDIAEAKGIALSLGEAREVADNIERLGNADEGISWATLHSHLDEFVASRKEAIGLSKLAKVFVLVCEGSLLQSFEQATGLEKITADLKRELSLEVMPERAVYNALKASPDLEVLLVSDFTNSNPQKLMP